MKINRLLIIAVCLLIMPSVSFALPAFPGAEGLGRDTVGGRGGQVIKVTNLNNDGVGSFRDALSTEGPRIVVFDVSGNINMTTNLIVREPFITIAGHTSPGGISVSGKQISFATHDVIIRHMRFRAGSHEYAGDDSDGDSLSILGAFWNGGTPVYNIMVDHCSVTWGTDETMTVTGGITAITIQNCIIAQGLGRGKELALGYTVEHSKGLFISGKYENDVSVSLYQNYIAHNNERSPLLYNPPLNQSNTAPNGNTYIVDGVNNVSYNWKSGLLPAGGGDAHINWIDNYAKEGPWSTRKDFIFMAADMEQVLVPEELFYLSGNIGNGRSVSDPDWLISDGWPSILFPETYRHLTKWPVGIELPNETMTYTKSLEIVEGSGATAPIRDSVDTAIINSYAAGTDMAIDNVAYPADWPTYATPAPPADTDNDGMADSWETTEGFNVGTDDSALDADSDGYTNIEEYLHSLSAVVFVNPSISIAIESQSTTNNSITITGTATPNATSGSAITSVTCPDQTVTGTTSWGAAVPLDVGSNTFVFTVTDSAGENATASVTITRTVIPSGDTLTISGCTIQGVTIQ